MLICSIVGSQHDTVDLYNSAKGEWNTAQLSSARDNLAASYAGNLAFFVGGSYFGAHCLIDETLEQELILFRFERVRLCIYLFVYGDVRCFGIAFNGLGYITVDSHTCRCSIWLHNQFGSMRLVQQCNRSMEYSPAQRGAQ